MYEVHCMQYHFFHDHSVDWVLLFFAAQQLMRGLAWLTIQEKIKIQNLE